MAKKDKQSCPECKKPEQASRRKGGERLLICNNGHSWREAAQEEKEKAATQEHKGYGIYGARTI